MQLQTLLDEVNELLSDSRYNSLSQAGELVILLREKLSPLQIKLSHEPLSKEGALKLLLTNNRGRADFTVPLVRESNGLILELLPKEGGGVYCRTFLLPPPDFTSHFLYSELRENWEDFELYPLKDGTSINLYWNGEDWSYSSRNSTSMASISWRGTTYKEAVGEVLSAYPEFQKTLAREENRELVFSLGFQHPLFHPFPFSREKGEPRAWLIQVWNRATGLLEPREREFGVSYQESEREDLERVLELVDLTLEECLSRTPPFLGYILRSRSRERADVLLESRLWNEIRHLLYQLPYVKNREEREHREECFKEMRYVIMGSFLDLKKHSLFIKLLPQFKKEWERLERVVQELTEQLYKDLTQPPKLPRFSVRPLEPRRESSRTGNSKRKPSEKEEPLKKEVQLLTERLARVVGEQFLPTPPGRGRKVEESRELSDKKVIRNILMNPKWLDIYVKVLFPSQG